MAGFSLRKLKLALAFSLLGYANSSLGTEQDPLEMSNTNQINQCVLILHGLARSEFAMRPLEKFLAPDYSVINIDYPSRNYPVEQLAELSINPALKQCQSADKVHFVTHSMGGILVRQYLAQNSIKNLGHVVMLGPPNQGSELVDYFQGSAATRWLFNLANGPAGAQLGTDANSIAKRLGPVDFSLGVIAGNVSYSPYFSRKLEGDDDGKVSVENSKVQGMTDHVVMPTSHTFMMRNNDVHQQVKHFLSHGKFGKPNATPE